MNSAALYWQIKVSEFVRIGFDLIKDPLDDGLEQEALVVITSLLAGRLQDEIAADVEGDDGLFGELLGQLDGQISGGHGLILRVRVQDRASFVGATDSTMILNKNVRADGLALVGRLHGACERVETCLVVAYPQVQATGAVLDGMKVNGRQAYQTRTRLK